MRLKSGRSGACRARRASRAAFSLLIEEESTQFFPVLRKQFPRTLQASEVARDAYRRHLETRTGDRAAMHYAGHVWLEAAHPADALTAVNALLALDPRDADAWFTKGEAHAQAGQLDAAIAAYQQAISFRPDFTRAAEQVKLTRSSRRTSR